MYHLILTRTIITETTEQNPIIEITHLKVHRHLIIQILYEITLIYSNYLPQILVAVVAMQ